MVQTLWKTVWQILIKLKIHLPYDLTTLLPGISKKNENIYLPQDTQVAYNSFIHNGQICI